MQVDTATKAVIAKAVFRLGAVGPPPRPPAEETRLSRWRRHTPLRDARAISHHYDVGNDFYALVLGPSMVYSCAYFEQPPSAAYTLQDAQRAKLDLVARKLALAPGQRVLDVGCGWGSFVIHAASEYGVHAVGITLSREQASWAREQVRAQGLEHLVEIRVQDYREVRDGPYDAIASIGMAEHVGLSLLPEYARHLHTLLVPGGRLLNHAIARRPGPPNAPKDDRRSFLYRYVFPDGELEPLATMVHALESACFEVRDVESLREHYPLTLRAWVANLEHDWDVAVALGGCRPGAGVVALHGRGGAAVPIQPDRGQPGAGDQARSGRCQRYAVDTRRAASSRSVELRADHGRLLVGGLFGRDRNGPPGCGSFVSAVYPGHPPPGNGMTRWRSRR